MLAGKRGCVGAYIRLARRSYYTQLSKLYSHLGIAVEDCDHSTNVFAGREGGPPGAAPCASTARLFGFSTRLGCIPWPDVTSWGVVAEYGAFLLRAASDFCSGAAAGRTFGDYIEARRPSGALLNYLLMPALASILTCSYAHVRAYPAEIVLEFLVLAATSRTRRVAGGAAEVVRRLAEPVQEVRTKVGVVAVRRPRGSSGGGGEQRGSEVVFADGRAEGFDAVVLACQANQAAALLDPADCAWDGHRAALGSVGYDASEVVVHTDGACAAPGGPSAWGSVNFVLSAPTGPAATGSPEAAARGRPEATIWLNSAYARLRGVATGGVHVFQSWNLWTPPAPASVLTRALFERPVLSLASLDGLSRLARLQGSHGVYVAGSFALAGMPLLDNGVASGLRVAAALGGRLPWEGEGGVGGAAAAVEALHSPLRVPRAEAEARIRAAAWVVAGASAGVVAVALAGAALALLGVRLAVQRVAAARR